MSKNLFLDTFFLPIFGLFRGLLCLFCPVEGRVVLKGWPRGSEFGGLQSPLITWSEDALRARLSGPTATVILSGYTLMEGDPPKKPPSQQKQFAQTAYANSFCLFSAYNEGKRGDNLYKLSRNCLRKLCFYLGGLLGWVSPS